MWCTHCRTWHHSHCCHTAHCCHCSHHWQPYYTPVPPIFYAVPVVPLRDRIRTNEPIRLTSTTRHAIKALAGRKG